MKGVKRVTALLLSIFSFSTCALAACGGAGEGASVEAGTPLSVYYGDIFTLPFNGKVTDSNGNRVTVQNGSFRATDLDGYSIEYGNTSYKIEVLREKPITVSTEFDEKYVVFADGRVEFPNVEANGAIGKVTKEYRLYKGTELYYFGNNAFIPDSTGDYMLQIKCVDEMGNSASKSVVYHVVEESDDKVNAIAVFDSPSGKEHFANLYGFTNPEFTEDMAFSGERGSTKMQISSENTFMQSFQLVNLFDDDISDDLGVYFNVYNSGTQTITLYVNWTYSFQLFPKQWNEIYLDDIDESQWSNNDVFSQYITSENINGLYFETYYDAQGGDCEDLYFSNMYKIPLYSANRFNRIIQDVNVTSETEAHYKSLVRAYHQFSTMEKKQINDFDKVEEELWKYYERKHGSTYTSNKLVDFNSTLFKEQAKITGGLAVYDDGATSAPNAQTGEKGATTITASKNSYTIKVEMTMPTTARYSSKEQDSDLNYLYNGYSVYIYCPLIEGCEVYCSLSGSYTTLDQGEWNEVSLMHGDKSLRGQNIQLYLAKNEAWDTPFPTGTEFVISSVYGKAKPTARVLNDYLQKLALLSDEEILSSYLSDAAFEAYRLMGYDQRSLVSGYSDFVKRYSLSLIPENERVGGIAYAFNTAKGLRQISASDCTVEFTTAKKYGANNGSLLVRPDARKDPWSAYVYLNAPTTVEYSAAYCYVWVEGSAESYQCSLSNPLDNSMYAKTRVELKKGAWTKLYIPVTTIGLLGCSLMFATKEWAWRIPDDSEFYVSPVYFEKYAGKDSVPTDENELPFVDL